MFTNFYLFIFPKSHNLFTKIPLTFGRLCGIICIPKEKEYRNMINKCPHCGSSAQFKKTNTAKTNNTYIERYECGCGCVAVRKLEEKILVYKPPEV